MLIMESLVEAARARLAATGFAGGNIEIHRDPPTTDAALPLASITYDNDKGDPVGNARTGLSTFDHTLTLVIDVIDRGATGAALMAKLAQHSEHVMQALAVNPWEWHDAVEGIGGVRQITEKSPEGAVIVYRRQIQIDVLYRTTWEPSAVTLPDLETIAIDTGIGAVPGDDENPGTPGLGAEIALPTD